MDIEQGTGTAIEELSREDEHPAGKNDEIDLQRNQDIQQIVLQRTARRRITAIQEGSREGGDTGIPRPLQRSSLWIVADHGGDIRLKQAGSTRVDERLEIRAFTRSQ